MALKLVLLAMTALALVVVLRPLVRRTPSGGDRREHELRVHRAQLAELERERGQGLLGAAEAEAARLEIKRRMLAADAASREAGPSNGTGAHRALAVIALLGLPALSGAIYWQLGSPGQPSVPYAQRADEVAAGQNGEAPALGELIARLEERTRARPDDATAWLRLGQAYAMARDPAGAVEALERAARLDPRNSEVRAALGEALVVASGGVVTRRAGEQFDEALSLDPADPRAQFYTGLALLQEGRRQEALDRWVELLRRTPPDAPWAASLRDQAGALAEDLGLDPDAVLPQALARAGDAAGPGPEDLRAAEEMSPEARQEMVRDMVEGLASRLEQQPDDAQGWRMLGRSYEVLGQPERSAEAYGRVAELMPDDLDAQVDYAAALAALDGRQEVPSARLIEQLDRVIRLDAGNPLALFFLGKAAAAEGAAEKAEGYWSRLLRRLPPDSPHRAEIERLIERLDSGG